MTMPSVENNVKEEVPPLKDHESYLLLSNYFGRSKSMMLGSFVKSYENI